MLHDLFLGSPHSVSSVLGDDDRFKKQHLIDGSPDTCWNSDEGKIQFATFKFSTPVNIRRVDVTFQGGFAANCVSISGGKLLPSGSTTTEGDGSASKNDSTDSSTSKSKLVFGRPLPFAAQDTNSTQSFDLSATGLNDLIALKLTFTNMTDTFGRIIVYHVKVYGTAVSFTSPTFNPPSPSEVSNDTSSNNG